jgi:transcriptional regulator GlxA family with amidase domain
MRVDILAFPGFDELDALGPLEVLRNAAKAGADLDVALVIGDGHAVTGSHAVTVQADGPFSDRADLLVVPGGGWNDHAADGVRAEVRTSAIPALLTAARDRGAIVAGVCTGAMLLAAAGLTTGRHAITHHAAVEDLRASGALVIQARVVDDGDMITAGGVTSGLDLALWLVERFIGAKLADGIASAMEYERRGTIWLRGRDPVPS